MKRLSEQLAESYQGPKVSYKEPDYDDDDDYDIDYDKYEGAEKDLYKDFKKLKPLVIKMFKDETKKFGQNVKRDVMKPVDVEIRNILKKFKAPDWRMDVEEIFENELFDLGIDGERYGFIDLGFVKYYIGLELDAE